MCKSARRTTDSLVGRPRPTIQGRISAKKTAPPFANCREAGPFRGRSRTHFTKWRRRACKHHLHIGGTSWILATTARVTRAARLPIPPSLPSSAPRFQLLRHAPTMPRHHPSPHRPESQQWTCPLSPQADTYTLVRYDVPIIHTSRGPEHEAMTTRLRLARNKWSSSLPADSTS